MDTNHQPTLQRPWASTESPPLQHYDYYTLKSDYLYGVHWETRLFWQRQFERFMQRLWGENWKARLLDSK